MFKKAFTIASITKSALTLGLVASTTVGCIIVIPPAPRKGDPFQPPPNQPVALTKGDTHKIRMKCGERAVFRSPMMPMDQFVVDFNAVNLQPADQLETASMRLAWRGVGVNTDMPINVGDKSQRNAKGRLSVTGGAGKHELVIAMEKAPACGPVNLTLSFK